MKSLMMRFLVAGGLCVVLAGCETDDLKQQNTRLAKEKADLQEQLTKKEKEVLDAKSMYSQAQAELTSKDQEVAALQQQLRDAMDKKPIAAQAPEGWEIKGGVAMISIPDELLFDSGKVTIKKDAQATLNKIAEQIKSNFAGKEVLVVGHTDAEKITKSKWTDNWELSAERGLAVARYMLGKGVPGVKIIAGGCGEYRPKVPVKGREARNRRVEILVYEPATR